MEAYEVAAITAGQAITAAAQQAAAQRRAQQMKGLLIASLGVLALVVMLKVAKGSRR